MLIELLSPSNYVSYNVKVAEILGLKPAIYLSQLIDINEKAFRKQKLENNFFKIDRKYIQSRTTLTNEEQIAIEKDFIDIGIIEKSTETKNTICLNITTLTSIMMTPDEDLIKDISSLSKGKKKTTKAEKIVENLKNRVITVNEELRDAYYSWIDSVISRHGTMTAVAVDVAQREIDKFSNRDLDIALKVLEIASIHGWVELRYAMEEYDKQCNNVKYSVPTNTFTKKTFPSNVVPPRASRLGDEVF